MIASLSILVRATFIAILIASLLPAVNLKAESRPTANKIIPVKSKLAWSAGHSTPRKSSSIDRRSRTAISIDSKGNVYLLDRLVKKGQIGYWLRKYSPSGKTEWTVTKSYKLPQKIRPQNVTIDNSDNVIVTSTAMLKGIGNAILIQKYSSSGKKQWSRVRNLKPRPGMGSGIKAVTDQQNNIYVAGTVGGTFEVSGSISHELNRVWLAKYGSDGKLVWEKFLGPEGNSSYSLTDIRFSDDVVHLLVSAPQGVPNFKFNTDGAPTDVRTHFDNFISKSKFTPWEMPGFFLRENFDREGPGGLMYRLPVTGPLDIWLEIGDDYSPQLRRAVYHIPQLPGRRSVEAKNLLVDKEGNAYVLAVEIGSEQQTARVFKVKIIFSGRVK